MHISTRSRRGRRMVNAAIIYERTIARLLELQREARLSQLIAADAGEGACHLFK